MCKMGRVGHVGHMLTYNALIYAAARDQNSLLHIIYVSHQN